EGQGESFHGWGLVGARRMVADGLMHNPPKERSPFRRVPFALALSLAVLGGTGCGKEPPVTGAIRVRYGDVWEEFPTPVSSRLSPDTETNAEFYLGPVFTFCNSDDLPGERRKDARGLCVYVDFDSFAKGRGPAEYAISGTAHGYLMSKSDVHFEPGLGHTSGLKEIWTQSFCPEEGRNEYVYQQLSGRLVLEENSEDRIVGQLELTVQGPTGGTCPGEAAEVDLDFDLPM
ncbi:hypothetical protein D7W79_41015, partial [Corallococcus exercitus]|uniref:hypothetical protein n=1 Tax=Corallococcus exercitus TaxID=2316736 RepID=UPI000EEABD57